MNLSNHRPKLLLLLIPLWIVASFSLIKMEGITLNFLHFLIFKTEEGPSYALRTVDRAAIRADEAIPAGARVFFFNPGIGDAGGFYAGRMKYQLYPRKLTVVPPDRDFNPALIASGDFLVFFIPPGYGNGLEKDLSLTMRLDSVYSNEDARGRLSVYRRGV